MPFTLPASLSRFHKGLILLAITMVLFSLVRGLFYFTYPEEFESLSGVLTLQAFANGLRFDGSIVVRLFLLPLLLWWLPLRWFDRPWWDKLWGGLLYLLTVGLVLMLLGDLIYFEHVQRHLSYELILMQNDLGFLLDFALKSQLLPLLAFALFAVALGWAWWRVLSLPTRASNWALPKFVGLFLLLAIVGRGGVSGKVIEIIDAYDNGNPAYGNLSLNGVFTTVVFALNLGDVDHHFMPQEKAVKLVRNGEPLLDPDYPMVRTLPGEAKRLNVVFVLLESWNFDHVDSFGGNGYGATPYFDALAEEGMRFSRFYAAGQRSIDGIQATLTGIPTLKGMPRIDTGIGISNFSRLGGILAEQGYQTLFVQSSERDSFKVAGIASAAGFEHFYGMEDMPMLLDYPRPEGAIFGWDYETLQFMHQRINELGEPFIAYAYTGTTHEPYPRLPERFMRHKHEPGGEGGYLNALSYADWSIGQFMEQARKEPWFDNTVFIFTADHVNHLQKGSIEKRFHTPMLVYAPKWVTAEERSVIGSQLDVVPTIMDLVGIKGEYSSLGESLLRKQGGGEAFVSFGGQQIGLITPQGFLQHDLKQVLRQHGIDEAELPRLEQRLLAMDQLSYELLQANRWAR